MIISPRQDYENSYLIVLKAKMTSISITPNFPAWDKIPTTGERDSSDSSYEPSRSNKDGWKDVFKITTANQIVAGSGTSYYITFSQWSQSPLSTSLLTDGMMKTIQEGKYIYQPFQMPTSSLAYTSTSDNWPEGGDLWVTGHNGLLSGFEYNAWTAKENNLDCRFDNQWHLIWRDKNIRNTKIIPSLDSGCYVNRNTSEYEKGAVPRLRSEEKFYDRKESDPIEYTIKRIRIPTINDETTRYRLYASPSKCWFQSLTALKNKPLIQLIASENPVYTKLTVKNTWSGLKAYDNFKREFITEEPKDCNEFLNDVKKVTTKVQVPALDIPKLVPASYSISAEIDTVVPYNHVPNYYERLKNKLEASVVLKPMMGIVNTTDNVVQYYSNNDDDLSTFSKNGVISGLPIPTADEMKSEQLNFINNFNELVHSLYKNGIKGSITAFRNLFGRTVNGKITSLHSTMAGSFAIPSFVNAILAQGKYPYSATTNAGYIANGIPFVGAEQQCDDSNELKISSNITFAKVLKTDVYNYPQDAYGGNLPTSLDYYADSANGNSLLIKNNSGTDSIKDLLPEREITIVRKEEQMASRLALKKDGVDHSKETWKIPFVYNLYLANSEDCTIYRDSFLSGVKINENINPCCCNLGNTRINQCGMDTTSVVNAAMVAYPYFYFKININNIYAKVKKELYDNSNLIPSSSGSHTISKLPKIMLTFMKQSNKDGLSDPEDLIEYDTKYTDQVKPTDYALSLRLIRNADFTTKTMPIYSVMQDLSSVQTCYSITYKN